MGSKPFFWHMNFVHIYVRFLRCVCKKKNFLPSVSFLGRRQGGPDGTGAGRVGKSVCGDTKKGVIMKMTPFLRCLTRIRT